MRLNEEALISKARAGDQQAFRMLARKYRVVIRSNASGIWMQGGDKDDLFQEGSIGLLEAIRDHDATKGPFYKFAELCIKRKMITAVKAAKRQKHASLNECISFDQGPSDSDEPSILERLTDFRSRSAEDVYLQQYETRCMVSGLAKSLSPLEVGSLRLRYNGYRYVDIALKLGVDVKAVDNALWRVKKKAAHELLAAN